MRMALRLSEKWFRRGLWLVALVAFTLFLIFLGQNIASDMRKETDKKFTDTKADIDIAAAVASSLGKATERDARAGVAAAANTNPDDYALALRVARRNGVPVETLIGPSGKVVKPTTKVDSDIAAAVDRSLGISTERDARASVAAAANTNPDDYAIQLGIARRTGLPVETVMSHARPYVAMQDTVNSIDFTDIAKNAPEVAGFLADSDKAKIAHDDVGNLSSIGLAARLMGVFIYRLAVTLPLLLLAGWLFVRQRQSAYWLFICGFVVIALLIFLFFAEPVPDTLSYGDYIRYSVGFLTIGLVGHYGIRKMQSYLAQQALVEQLPEEQRREDLNYEQALTRMEKKVCPGCERSIDPEATNENFCTHCGIGLFKICKGCASRNNAFTNYCKTCGCAVSEHLSAASLYAAHAAPAPAPAPAAVVQPS